MKVIFLNTHSILNSGDMGIVLAQVQFLKKNYPDTEISLTSRTPEIDEKFYRQKKIKIFPPLIPAPSIFTGWSQKIDQSLKNLYALKSKKNFYGEVKKSDLVISSGGGYFYSNRRIFPGPMFLQNSLHIKLAFKLNKQVIFFPQSFGPFYNPVSTKILKNILEDNKTVRIFTREKISFDYLYNLLKKEKSRSKLDLCPDMTFYLNRNGYLKDSRLKLNLPKPVIALTLRKWDFPECKAIRDKKKKEEDYLKAIEEVCHSIFKKWGGSVVVFPQGRGPGIFEDDRIVSKRFIERVKKIIPEKNMLFIDLPVAVSPSYIMNIFSQVDLVLATRFHSAIFSLISGIPVVSITYQPKSKGIMRLLKLEHFCVDIAEINSERILRLIEEILANPILIKQKVKIEVSNTKDTIESKLKNALNSFFFI